MANHRRGTEVRNVHPVIDGILDGHSLRVRPRFVVIERKQCSVM